MPHTPQTGRPDSGAPVAVVDAQAHVQLDDVAMTGQTALAVVPQAATRQHVAPIVFDDERITILKTTIMPASTDAELDFFMIVCKRTGLDPFARQIHAVKRGGYEGKARDRKWVDKWVYQVAIDGFRLIAERTGKYRGQTLPLFCGDDGVWREVWLNPSPPRACKVGVLRSDFDAPLYAVALWDEYVQLVDAYEGEQKVGKKPNSMWASKPCIMLAKVAEALALRKAFPQEMSGLYTDDEMMQADNTADDKAASRRASQTQAGEQARGATTASVNYAGSGPLFPYAPYKGVPLAARYNEGATRTKKKKGAPDEVIPCGGEYVVSEKRLDEMIAWAEGKLKKHRDAEQNGETTSKDYLLEADYMRVTEMAEDGRTERLRRAAHAIDETFDNVKRERLDELQRDMDDAARDD